MAQEQIATGSCFCGMVAAELSGPPLWICFDHDDDCRKAVGAPLNVWVGYRAHQVHYARGLPRSFSKTTGVVRTFCADCGTSIGYRDEGLHDEVYLTIGFLDRPELFRPQAHAYWGMKLPWLKLGDRLPRIEGYSRDRSPDLGRPRDR